MDKEHISDNRLAGFLRHYLQKEAYQLGVKLKGLRLCGCKMAPKDDKVFLLANNQTALFTNVLSCHSIWACPKCAPLVLTQRGEKIGAAIDYLARYEDQHAFFVTFTLPHTADMKFNDTMTILMDSWRFFSKATHVEKRKKQYTLKTDKVGEKGTVVTHLKANSAYGTMRGALKIKHCVKVYDVTHGKNSWHPHIHMLFWCPDKYWDKIITYEKKLQDRWWYCCKRSALEYYDRIRPDKHEENQKKVDDLFNEARRKCDGIHNALFISKDKDGKVRKEKSARYIAGWGANMEMTALNMKQAGQGHRTPFQILEDAYIARYVEQDKEKCDKEMALFLEYAEGTFKKRRIEFSPQLGKLIRKYMESEEYYTTYLKKKAMDRVQKNGRLETVMWFSAKQWSDIFACDYFRSELDVIVTLLETAKLKIPLDKRRSIIIDFLQRLNIDVSQNEQLEYHVFEEEQIAMLI